MDATWEQNFGGGSFFKDKVLIYSEAISSGAAAVDLGMVSVKGRREAVRLFAEGDLEQIRSRRDVIARDEAGIRDLS